VKTEIHALTLRLNTIHAGDCIAGMKKLGDGVVDLAFADPPFNIGYDYDVYRDKLESDRYLAWSRDWMAQVVRVLKPDGTFWLAIGDEYAAELKVMLQRELRMTCRSWVVWYYTFGVNCKNKFSRSHAHLFQMVKDPEHFTFDIEAIRVPSARQLVYADHRANPKGRLPDDTWILRPQDCPEGFQPDHDTWYFPRVCGTFSERAGWHGCQMPEQLLGRIIRASSREKDLVLDPFGGSGTTLAVAKKLKRRFVGFELSAEYVAKVEERLALVRSGDPLEGAAEPLASAPSTADGRALKEFRNAEAPRRVDSPRGRIKVKGQRTLPGLAGEGE
jgi:site-specific DNA-methyltransferase (adenine-specific)